MQKLQSRVVVSLPVYNEGPYVLETLKSLAAQTHVDFQALVADNASSDDTGRICQAFCAADPRFHYVRHEENLGASANFRFCFEQTDSEYFMWLGGHDVLAPEFLAETLTLMEADERISLTYTQTQWIDEQGQALGRTNGGNYVFDEPLAADERYLRVLHALDRCEAVNQLIRRDCIDMAFRPVVSADLAFLCHLAAHGPFARVEKPLYLRREISNRTSSAMERMTGKKVAPRYHELASLFTESICSHRSLGAEAKPVLVKEVLAWMDKRFALFSSVTPKPEAQTVTPSNGGPAPFFSVVMPVYNRERYVREAIESVLAQDDADFELVVVDDGSTDRSVQIIRSIQDPRVRLLHNHHGGGASARNTGLAAARGEFVVWIDSDDLQAKGALAALRRSISQNPDADVFYGDLEIFDERFPGQVHHTRYADYQGKSLLPMLIQANCLPNPGTAVRRSLYQRHGEYDTAFTRCHDYQIWTRLADTANFKKVETVLCHWRQHGESLSSAKTRAFEGKVVLDAFSRYPVSRLFPDLADDQAGQGAACWRVANTLRQLGEFGPALRMAHKACALGQYDAEALAELEKLAGPRYEPLLSVIMTTYNRPELLKDALASVGRQTLRDFEVILANDHGDPVESLLQAYDFPITYLYQGRNQGPAAARNAALKLAKGRYVVFLDDDDVFLPDHFQVLAEALVSQPDSVVYSDAVFITESIENGERIELAREQRYPHDAFSRDRLFVNNYIPVNTFAGPRELIAGVGGFDESLSGLEDWDFLMRLAARAEFHHVPAETVEVRMRQVEPARRSEQALKDYPALYRELYSRHSDGGSDAVRAGRDEMLRRMGGSGSGVRFHDWLAKRSLTAAQQRLVDERLAQHGQGPSVGIVVLDLKGDKAALAATLASLEPSRLTYRNIQPLLLTVAAEPVEGFAGQVVNVAADDWVAPLNEALGKAGFDWLTLVGAGDELTANGLLMACLELLNAPDCRAIYCDEMYRQADGSLGAAFRPALNLDYLLSFPAGMAHHWLFRRDVLLDVGGFDAEHSDSPEFELILRLISQGGLAGLGHVAETLLITDAPALADLESEKQAILQHLRERGYQRPQVTSNKPGRYRIRYGHPQQPMVSILVMAGGNLARLQRCVESVLESTRYPRYELLLVESDQAAVDVRDWLKVLEGMGEPRLRPIWPSVSCSTLPAAMNLAASKASGDYLLLLSPDTAVVDGDWLDELVNHAQRPEVGVVGGCLLGADGKVRHAGLVLGLEGPVGRPFVGEALDAPGYMQRLQVDVDYSAVSRDCLMIPRELYLELGGVADDVTDHFLDLDLCLRARQAGFLSVWANNARLMLDPEEAPTAVGAAEQDVVFGKWLPVLARDPAYNPNFSLAQPGGFKLADTAISWRPLSSWKPLPTVLAHPADFYGCGHYRVMQPFSALQQTGLVDGALSVGLMHVTDLERYEPDTIILQRQIGDERLEAMRRMKALSGAFKIYELDDYLPNLPIKSVHRENMPKDIVKSFRRGLSYVDRFVVSTDALAEAFAGMHEDIHVVENRLPVGWWKGVQGLRRTKAKPRVGWAGGASHTGDLELIADVIKELANEVEWVFFGMCPDKLRPYIHEYYGGVAIEQYPAALARLNLDLALAPVEQNLFNECKSNLRLLEYGACGFPVICSDIRCYQGDLPVTRVKNRFKDWVEAIRMHLADLDAAARLGDELQAVVHRDWMLEGRNLELWRQAWTPGSR
ncbi:glycosyltransferase [Pseudomonas resinovorans]|uniref:glycosyltransferase n=1 Tax=Metapseudomonas resinovorans TaxID=53412 RepID=UPI00237F7766|nr:glycosyltransferase [Pseudomonas resinovorans]MDE3740129.1 glycosyltransferase [Pseudomonas resinovorans]